MMIVSVVTMAMSTIVSSAFWTSLARSFWTAFTTAFTTAIATIATPTAVAFLTVKTSKVILAITALEAHFNCLSGSLLATQINRLLASVVLSNNLLGALGTDGLQVGRNTRVGGVRNQLGQRIG